MAEPYRELVEEEADQRYQILSHIEQSTTESSDDYDYPEKPFYDRIPNPPSTPPPKTSASGMNELSVHVSEDTERLLPLAVCSTTSESEGTDSEALKEPVLIRQELTETTSDMDKGDEKLYLTGDFHCLGFTSSVAMTDWGNNNNNDDDEFENEGIYQGLVMTDTQKKNFGIMPESIYMTTSLLQKGQLIESISVSLEKEDLQMRATIPVSNPPPPPKPARSRNVKTDGETKPRTIVPHYRELILRPPPLPPLESGANRAAKKCSAVVENMLKSEAAYLTSLNIAISIYMTPLMDISEGPSPIITSEEVKIIFGPIEDILAFQQVFYSAITSRTLDWSPQQKIGDVLSSLSTKDVVQNYSGYVNNFTMAMAGLEKAICKKPRFVQFLKEKYANSRTSLSLQGLLLKPVQRFPQYILCLRDLIKYTSTNHPDRVTLQMALARFEGVANFLNESKRQREQKAVVQYLNNKISRLPFKLTDAKRLLHRQDIVTRLMISNGQLVKKERCLLFFNNMVLCAATRKKKKKRSSAKIEDLEGSTGSRDFQSVTDYFYICKWFCPLDQLDVVQPDYLNDVWDLAASSIADATSEYSRLKDEYKKMEQDYSHISRIMTIAASLQQDYTGLTCDDLASHIRVLQRKIAMLKEDLRAKQQGRLDIVLPSRENDSKVCHTYSFMSEKIKLDWVNNLRYAKRKLCHPVVSSWVIAEDVSAGDIFEVSYKLPLFVDSYNLNMMSSDVLSVQCATKVGKSCTWIASGDTVSALISIMECVTPTPIILECFRIDSRRIIDLLYVPPSNFSFSPNTNQTPFTLLRQTIKKTGFSSMTQIPSYLATVWMGAQSGKLSIYSADSAGDGSKHCLSSVKLGDAITSLQYYENQVFACTAEGTVVIFKRSIAGFNLCNYKTVHALPNSDIAIRCSCRVGNKLWLGIGQNCYFLNMQTHKMEGSLDTCAKEGVVISKMVNQGEGVWLSYKGSSSIELFHTLSKISLQNIDIRSTLSSIIKRHKLESRLTAPSNTHVTSLMAVNGYLWIGTSIGAIMVYHIPHLESVPVVSGKPYLAMDSHLGAVRVLLTVETMATPEASRVRKFLVDEEMRSNVADEGGSSPPPEEKDQNTLVRKRSRSEPVLTLLEDQPESSVTPIQGTGGGGGGDQHTQESGGIRANQCTRRSSVDQHTQRSGRISTQGTVVASDLLDRSVTPTLLPPSSFLEDVAEGDSPVVAMTSPPSGVAENSIEVEVEGGVPIVSVAPSAEVGGEDDGEDDDYSLAELASKERFRGGIRSSQVKGSETLELTTPSQIEESLVDSGDYTIPSELDAICGLNSGQARGVKDDLEESPYSNPSELSTMKRISTLELERRRNGGGGGGEEEESPYSDPSELNTMKRISTPELERRRNGGGEEESPYSNLGELSTMKDEVEGPYSNPSELDTLRRISNQERRRVVGDGNENPYDFPSELVKRNLEESGNPYEDPATLANKDPSTPLSELFSPKVLNASLYIHNKSIVQKEGSIFVLTAGRGLLNLRAGKKATLLNQANKDAESCMMAYEIEI